MNQPPYLMDQPRREAVLAAIVERCLHRGWELIAAHVRTNHVHVIVETNVAPERVMNELKVNATRVLNHRGFDSPDRRRWARHGSIRRLRERVCVASAMEYVLEKQGDAMATFCAPVRA